MNAPGKTNIQVVPYDPLWPSLFERESQKIKAALGDNCITVHHVGSTAIPGIWAKPIIDMIPVVKDIALVHPCNEAMAKLGYVAKGEYGMLFRRYFQRKEPQPACNVHVYEAGAAEIERLTAFRDFLTHDEAYRKKYADLKKLISQHANNMTEYTLAKDALIKEIDEIIGLQGYRIVHALSTREWEAYYRILQDTVYQQQGVLFDSTHDDRTEKNNLHLVLYKGSEVIGAALLTLDKNHERIIQHLAIDKAFQNEGCDTVFLRDIKRWISIGTDT